MWLSYVVMVVVLVLVVVGWVVAMVLFTVLGEFLQDHRNTNDPSLAGTIRPANGLAPKSSKAASDPRTAVVFF